MSFWYHYLSEDDFFLDIGANIGVYSILDGIKTKGIAFEPAEDTFLLLNENISINNSNVEIKKLGVSNKSAKLRFSTGMDSTNHIVQEESTNAIEIDVVALDDLKELLNKKVTAIKIDVEGSEKYVLGGVKNIQNSLSLNVILCEAFSMILYLKS